MKKNILLFAVMLIISAACKKENTAPEPNGESAAAPTGIFMLHLHNYIENSEVDNYNIVYTTDAGRKFSLSLAQFFLSEIEIVKADGTVHKFSDAKILKLQEKETYLVGNVPVGNYKSIRFKVGLNPDKADPHAGADSTILNRNEMWFGTDPQVNGYVYMNVQGKIDTTADATATNAQMQNFVFKVGTSANYRQVIMPDKNFTIVADQVEYGHILVDYTKLFAGIDLSQPANLSVTTTNDNASATAAKLANNIPSLFVYEQ